MYCGNLGPGSHAWSRQNPDVCGDAARCDCGKVTWGEVTQRSRELDRLAMRPHPKPDSPLDEWIAYERSRTRDYRPPIYWRDGRWITYDQLQGWCPLDCRWCHARVVIAQERGDDT